MTIAMAYARRDEGAGAVWVIADSKLTIGSAHTDVAIKTLDLGETPCAVVTAGSVLPANIAAEMARPLIRATNRSNRMAGKPVLSLWDVTRLLLYPIGLVRDQLLSSGLRPAMDVLVTGFYSDGVPGIARVRLSQLESGVAFYRPRPDKSICVAVGEPGPCQIVYEAVRRSQERELDLNHLVSLFWYLIQSGAPEYHSIGGGISLGGCSNESEEFQWPAIEIANAVFLRGIEVSGSLPSTVDCPDVYEFDDGLAAELDQESADGSLPRRRPIARLRATVDQLNPPGLQFSLADEPPELLSDDVPADWSE